MMRSLTAEKVQYRDLSKHETKQHIFIKFLLVLAIALGYFVFITLQYGVSQGVLVTLISWSFFVLCTPIADAGFLVDFPLRLVTRIRMLFSEMFVWFIAISVNVYALLFNLEIYETTSLLRLFKHILYNPIPFWSIILISCAGTFVSIQFGDELIDKIHHHERAFYHKHKYKYNTLIMVFIFVGSIILYDILLKQLGVDLPL